MACSRCGAPLEFANGAPVACRFCGSVERAPEPTASHPAEYHGGGQSYGHVEVVAPDADDFEEEGSVGTRSTGGPPPYVPSASGSVVGRIVMVAAIVLGAVVVFSIVASSGSSDRHHPSHPHHHGR